MPEEISLQILSQTSENIQKLFDLSTRIDERVKAIQSKQEELDVRMTDVARAHTDVMQKVAVLESKNSDSRNSEIDQKMTDLDKRLTLVENSSNKNQDRWNKIFTFVIQLLWVILASYLLMKLNLQAPQVP